MIVIQYAFSQEGVFLFACLPVFLEGIPDPAYLPDHGGRQVMAPSSSLILITRSNFKAFCWFKEEPLLPKGVIADTVQSMGRSIVQGN